MNFYLHVYLPKKLTQAPQTFKITLTEEEYSTARISHLINTIKSLSTEINPTYVQVKQNLSQQPIKDNNRLLQSFFKNGDDIYLFCELPRPVKVVTQEKQIAYIPIQSYTFYDDENRAKVILPLPGIGSLPKEQIQSIFLQKSFSVKIRDYKGQNLEFSVPKLSEPINPDGSKILQKPDKIIISLLKKDEKTHFHSLFKSKAVIGGDVSD